MLKWLYLGFHLLTNLPHSLHIGVSTLLVNVVKADDGHLVMLANGHHTLIDGVGKNVVQNEVEAHVGIMVDEVLQHIGHGGTETVEVLPHPAFVLVFADGGMGPVIIRCTENQDDVRRAETVQAGTERTVGKVGCLSDVQWQFVRKTVCRRMEQGGRNNKCIIFILNNSYFLQIK